MKEIDWANLSFGYMKTDYNVRINFRNGAWGELEVSSDEHLNLHMAATCLHYGQEAFEGLKAFRGKDGKVRIFRLEENAARLQSTCQGILMAELPTERFKEAILKVVKLNERFIPPYETGASLYIRPLLIGTSAQVGVHPAEEYMFVVFVTPVGPYFKGGFSTNPYVIIREFDRAAPHGTGIYKVGGNYAASLRANKKAHDLGYSCEFYLDAKEKKYIDECGAANFFGIKDNTYITPKSSSILPSITNKSLMQLAEDMGIKVERRPIPEEELETFEEAGACGTAAVSVRFSVSMTWRTENHFDHNAGNHGNGPGVIHTHSPDQIHHDHGNGKCCDRHQHCLVPQHSVNQQAQFGSGFLCSHGVDGRSIGDHRLEQIIHHNTAAYRYAGRRGSDQSHCHRHHIGQLQHTKHRGQYHYQCFLRGKSEKQQIQQQENNQPNRRGFNRECIHMKHCKHHCKKSHKSGGQERTQQRYDQHDGHVIQLCHISHFAVYDAQHDKAE